MDVAAFCRERRGRLAMVGGLDATSALPRLGTDEVRTEVRRVFALAKPGGGFLFAPSHLVQEDTPLDVLEAAYDEAARLAPYPG